MDTGQVQAGRSGLMYAALGDSMSIDHYAGGPGRGAARLLWRNRDDDFPGWAGHDLTAHDPAAQLALLASDGATSTTVADEQLQQLHRLELIPTLATVTMGGNDLLAAYGSSSAARQAIEQVTDNGQRLLASLRALMGPMAPIVIATVYDPSDGTGDAVRLGLPVWPEALDLLADLTRPYGRWPRSTRHCCGRLWPLSRSRPGHRRPRAVAAASVQPRLVVLRPDRAQRLGRQRDPSHLLGGTRDRR
jgi:lysophospholipase L1-like esterase